jgi:hypothetical protein
VGRLELELDRHQVGVAADRVRVLGSARVANVERLGERDHGGELEVAGAVAGAEQPHRLRAVDHRAVAAQLLRGEHRALGGARQGRRIGAVVGMARDAEAERHGHGRVADAPPGGAPQALGEDVRTALVGLRQQQSELIAADAGGAVDAPFPLAQVAGDEL